MATKQLDLAEANLLTYVQRLLEKKDVQLGAWSSERLGWKASNSVTGGLYRIRGTANCGTERLEWSMIMKEVLPSPETDDPAHYCYWKREPLLYQSGLLEML